ncbi:hypothetical protein J6590_052431 [Homalodisca vitripennis]|nr:hypothetical protein J6590_052431 [Homalodisca vitripennis]
MLELKNTSSYYIPGTAILPGVTTPGVDTIGPASRLINKIIRRFVIPLDNYRLVAHY